METPPGAEMPLARFESLPSTNDEVKRRLRAGERPPFAVVAFQQTAGYGRTGRTWESPFGGLYLSIGWRPEAATAALPTISLVTALAVRSACVVTRPAMASALLVKWPNDLVVARGDGFSKLAGISLETVADALCIGIGVNVFPVSDAAPIAPYPMATLEEKRDVAPDAAEQRALIERLARDVGRVCEDAFARWERDGFAAFVDDYNACSALADRSITVVDREGANSLSGIAGDVDADGRLTLVDAEGALHRIASGEAHIAESLYRHDGSLQ